MGAGGGNERPWSTGGRSSGGYKEGEGLTLQRGVGGAVVRCARADGGGPGFEPVSCCLFFFLFFYIVITPVLYMFPSYGGERWWRGRSTSGLGRQGASSIGGGEGCGSVGRRGVGERGSRRLPCGQPVRHLLFSFVIFNYLVNVYKGERPPS